MRVIDQTVEAKSTEGKRMFKSARWRMLLVLVASFLVLAGIVWAINRRKGTSFVVSNNNQPRIVETSPASEASPSTTAETINTPSLEPTPDDQPSPSPSPSAQDVVTPELLQAPGFVGTLRLIIPVSGVRPDQLLDTFSDSRSEGRAHDAIDIPAAAGTPVVAVADGEIAKLFQSERGGTTIYQYSVDRKLIFYYAHLQGYAAGLEAGKRVRQGEVIGFVGDTGNAGPGNYHLHFSITVLGDPKRYWEGTNINPYPILRGR